MARHPALIGGTIGLLVALGASPAVAAESASDKASAEALFDAALRDMKAGKFSEACPKLENSQRIDPGVGTLLYLGECYERLGRTASAWATFREAASQAEAEGQVKRAKAARERIAKLEPQLAYLTLEVAESTRNLQGLHIRRNGVDSGLGIIGAAVPQDPGATTIEVSAPEHESFSVTVNIQPQGHQTVLIPSLAAVESSAPAVAAVPAVTPQTQPQEPPRPAPPPAPENTNTGTAQRVVGISLAGVGLVGIGIGTYFGVTAMNKDKKADANCSPTVCQEQTDYNESRDANKAATASNVAFAVGGGLVATGVVVFLLAPHKHSTVGVTPLVAPGFAGVSVGGRL